MPENQQTEEIKLNEEYKVEDEYLEWQPDYSFQPEGRHVYRQQGYYLICKSCELQHAIFIGANKVMVGENEDGTPLLKMREDL